MTMSDYELVREIPSVEDYLRVRKAAGLGAKSVEGAKRGLPNTMFAAQALYQGEVVAFCRLIGDGGLFYMVTDGVVLPEHQGRGLGSLVLGECAEYFKKTAPPGAYLMGMSVSPEFVKKVGFDTVSPPETGVFIWLPASWGD